MWDLMWRLLHPVDGEAVSGRLQTHHLPSVLNHDETEHVAQSAAAVILAARRGINASDHCFFPLNPNHMLGRMRLVRRL